MATLRVYISRLRRALGPAAAALVTQPPGYLLQIEPGSPIPAPDLVRSSAAVAATEPALGKERLGAARAARQDTPVRHAVELAREATEPGAGAGKEE